MQMCIFVHIWVILRGLTGIRGDQEFYQKYENSQFVGITKIDFTAKNQRIMMSQSENPPFFCHFKKIEGDQRRLRIFSKICLEHFCRLTAKFQKKVMNGFRETAVQTNERTDTRDSLCLKRLRRETKNTLVNIGPISQETKTNRK